LPTPPSVPPSSLLLSPTSPSPPAQEPCVSPQAMKVDSIVNPCKGDAEGIVVHTCQPCHPPISATQIEGELALLLCLSEFLLILLPRNLAVSDDARSISAPTKN
jgi:hypothetical protein